MKMQSHSGIASCILPIWNSLRFGYDVLKCCIGSSLGKGSYILHTEVGMGCASEFLSCSKKQKHEMIYAKQCFEYVLISKKQMRKQTAVSSK